MATWTFEGPLQNEGLGTVTTFLVTVYPTRNALGDSTKWISLGATNGSGKGWNASAESYTTNRAVAAPIVSGNTLAVDFPQNALSGWVSQPFWWSAQEQTVQIGIPTGDPSNPIDTSVSGGAIVACPSPSGGYQSAVPTWTSGDLVQFPGGHEITGGGTATQPVAFPTNLSTLGGITGTRHPVAAHRLRDPSRCPEEKSPPCEGFSFGSVRHPSDPVSRPDTKLGLRP